jgi:hypothetical protein
MMNYRSNDEFFQAFRDIVRRIERDAPEAAQELREGFSCLNGLTDGWALLMESIDRTLSQHRGNLAQNDRVKLERMLSIVNGIVYRR